MRVLHIITSLGAGGAERSLAEMLPAFDAAGIESSIACMVRKPDGVHESVESAGYTVRVVGADRLKATRRIRRVIGAWEPDIVHTTLFDADVLGRLAALGKPCKVLTSLVNTTYDGVRVADTGINPFKFAAAKAVDRTTARYMTDHFHAISSAARDSAIRHMGIPSDRITVVNRGRNLERLGTPSRERRAAVRCKLDLPSDAEVVLHTGRQELQKGLGALLEAIVTLMAERPHLVMLQAGREGKATQDLHRIMINAGVATRIRFLGHRADVGDLLAASDVFVFPSIYEGAGGSVLEAMAMRVPIVVSDIPALSDVVEPGRAGVVVPVGDRSALAQAIGHLLDHPDEAAQMADRAQRIFLDRFTLERSVEGMVDLYGKVLAEGKVL